MNKLTQKTGDYIELIGADVLLVPTRGKTGAANVMLSESVYQAAVDSLFAFESLGYTPAQLKKLMVWAAKLATLSAEAKSLNLDVPDTPIPAPPTVLVKEPSQLLPESNIDSQTQQLPISALGLSPVALRILEDSELLTIGAILTKTLVELRGLTAGSAYQKAPEAFTFELDNALKSKFGVGLRVQ